MKLGDSSYYDLWHLNFAIHELGYASKDLVHGVVGNVNFGIRPMSLNRDQISSLSSLHRKSHRSPERVFMYVYKQARLWTPL